MIKRQTKNLMNSNHWESEANTDVSKKENATAELTLYFLDNQYSP